MDHVQAMSSRIDLCRIRGKGQRAAQRDVSPQRSESDSPSVLPQAQDFWETSLTHHAKWDQNQDGFLSNQEIEEQLKNKNLDSAESASLETLRGRQKDLQAGHNDEFAWEKRGITPEDLKSAQNSQRQQTQIMQEQFLIEYQLAEDKRERGSAEPGSKPADLREKIGTRDYYLERYKDFRKRNPDEKAPTYYLNYGLKYYDRFDGLKSTVSELTQEWITRTASTLQEKMETANFEDGKKFADLERSPEEFKEFAYDSHPSAYMEGGLSSVPLSDLVRIPFVPNASDVLSPIGLSQGVTTGLLYANEVTQGMVKTVLSAAKAAIGVLPGVGFLGDVISHGFKSQK